MLDSSIVERAIIDVECTDSEFAALDQAFRDFGFDLEIQRALVRKSVGDHPWAMYLTLAPGVLVASFFKAIADEAGRDVYEWLKSVAATRKQNRGSIVVQDEEHTNVVLHTALTPEAVRALESIDWENASGAHLVWDEDSSQWYDPVTQRRDFQTDRRDIQ